MVENTVEYSFIVTLKFNIKCQYWSPLAWPLHFETPGVKDNLITGVSVGMGTKQHSFFYS